MDVCISYTSPRFHHTRGSPLARSPDPPHTAPSLNSAMSSSTSSIFSSIPAMRPTIQRVTALAIPAEVRMIVVTPEGGGSHGATTHDRGGVYGSTITRARVIVTS